MNSIVQNNIPVSIEIGKEVAASPLVSIIIPAFNVAEFISETLRSVFSQTFENFEILIVNDGSADTEILENNLKPFADRIAYLKIPNSGAGAARNIGISNARGELLAFLDGDDVWFPEYLESQTQFLLKNGLDLVYSDALIFGGSAADGTNFMLKAPSEGMVDFKSLLDLRCNLITSGTLVRKQKVLDAGMFEWERVRAHDFVLWLKLARNGSKIDYQKKVLLKYRVRIKSLTGDSIQNIKREINVFNRLPGIFELSQEEQEIKDKHLQRLNAALEIEKGKTLLLQKDFSRAREAFQSGNSYYRSIKYRFIILTLSISPNLLLYFFRFLRSKEIAFITVGGE